MDHALFSTPALKAFKHFLKVDATTKSLRPKGAVDAVSAELKRTLARDAGMTKFTPYTRAMSNTRGDKRKGARDQEWTNPSDLPPEDREGFAPDPETVAALLAHVREQWGDEFAERYGAALEQKWPGCLGEAGESDDEADRDEGDRDEGEEAFDRDFPGTTEREIGGPASFAGEPRRGAGIRDRGMGGRFAGDASVDYARRFPDAVRLDAAPDYGPAGSRSRFDAFGRPVDGRPLARNSRSGRRGRSEASLALDARSENHYGLAWPDALRIGIL